MFIWLTLNQFKIKQQSWDSNSKTKSPTRIWTTVPWNVSQCATNKPSTVFYNQLRENLSQFYFLSSQKERQIFSENKYLFSNVFRGSKFLDISCQLSRAVRIFSKVLYTILRLLQKLGQFDDTYNLNHWAKDSILSLLYRTDLMDILS